MSLDSKTPSLEAIQYQGESKLFKDLIRVFEKLALTDRVDSDSIKASDFSKVVFDNTGLKVVLNPVPGLEAFVQIPAFSPQNAHLNNRILLDKLSVDQAQFRLIRKLGSQKSYEGTVDLVNSRVSGVFSEIEIFVGLGSAFLGKDAVISPREITAVVLHELGHVFTHFETMAEVLTATVTVGSALTELSKEKVVEKRFKILNGLTRKLDLKDMDDQSLVAHPEKDIELAMVVLREYALIKTESRFGSSSYDFRSCEQLADQFANRHGAGPELTRHLLRYGRSNRQSFVGYLTVQFMHVVGFVAAVSFAPLTTTTCLIFGLMVPNMDRDVYDPPSLRIERLRKDLIQVLKSPSLTREHRERVLGDIEFMKNFAEDEEQYRSIFMFLWTTISTRRRKEYDRKKFQLEIEKLLNNELFVSANQLKSMS